VERATTVGQDEQDLQDVECSAEFRWLS
jgi:hypothetical protein